MDQFLTVVQIVLTFLIVPVLGLIWSTHTDVQALRLMLAEKFATKDELSETEKELREEIARNCHGGNGHYNPWGNRQ